MAREALQKGIVLLKNAEGDDGKKLLPLDKKAIKKVVRGACSANNAVGVVQ